MSSANSILLAAQAQLLAICGKNRAAARRATASDSTGSSQALLHGVPRLDLVQTSLHLKQS
jgi:hypothetical protein